MDNWTLIAILTPAFLGWSVAVFSIGYNRGWKEARKWGSP